MRTASPPPSGNERRQFFRVDTTARLKVAPLPEGESGPPPSTSDVVLAHQQLLESLHHLRLDLDSSERLVVDKVSRFCTAIAAAVEDLEAHLRGEEPGRVTQLDLSGGGLGWVGDQSYSPGTRLRVGFQLLEVLAPGLTHAVGEVVYCRPVGRRYRTGVRFVGLEEEARQRLVAAVFEIQRLRLRSAS